MKKISVKTLSLLLALLMICTLSFPAFAVASVFDDGAYASIVTASDFQNYDMEAYNRFDRILGRMKNDGLETPHSMLMGGDFTMVLFDYPTPGVVKIRNALLKNYPDFNPDNVVCVQGNHDNVSSYFTKTGFYDMGEYCLYAINEDDFPWLQNHRIEAECKVKSLSENIKAELDNMINTGDTRPVIVITHVPLHHSVRDAGADNMYSSYIFRVLNEAGKTLDIAFLFGHNHSKSYDDYIGGTVNFMAPGDTIRIPDAQNPGKTNYTEETLTFTYLNCGYTGYSGNSVNEASTDVLTAGIIRLTDTSIHYLKYTEDGLYSEQTVARKNPVNHTETVNASGTEIQNRALWERVSKLIQWIFDTFARLTVAFGNQ